MGGEKLKSSRPVLGIFFAAVFFIFSFLFVSFPLSAQDAEPAVPSVGTIDESTIILGETLVTPATGSSSSPVFLLIRMVLVLALCALAIYGVVFLFKRLAKPQESRDPHLKILARVPLSTDSYAAVISVGAKAWLIAGASGAVNVISEIDDIESLETMLLDDARRTSEFGNRRLLDFRSLLGRFGSPQEDKGIMLDSSLAEALRKQRERLRGLQ